MISIFTSLLKLTAPLIRSIFSEAGIEAAELYSAHSLRRGFANWAISNGWDFKDLMRYVGWKNINSAPKYIDNTNNFKMINIEDKE